MRRSDKPNFQGRVMIIPYKNVDAWSLDKTIEVLARAMEGCARNNISD